MSYSVSVPGDAPTTWSIIESHCQVLSEQRYVVKAVVSWILQSDNNLGLYQDEYLPAINKPAGIIVHADGTHEPSLTEVVCRNSTLLRAQAK